jgi:asparaginyl-tRNA synthetase
MKYPEFPDGVTYTPISEILDGRVKDNVKLRGWIYRTRSSGKLAFVIIRDSTGIIQCTVLKMPGKPWLNLQ